MFRIRLSTLSGREVNTAVLAKQLREHMGLMPSRDAYDMKNHGMIEDCPFSTNDVYRETAIWARRLGVHLRK